MVDMYGTKTACICERDRISKQMNLGAASSAAHTFTKILSITEFDIGYLVL